MGRQFQKLSKRSFPKSKIYEKEVCRIYFAVTSFSLYFYTYFLQFKRIRIGRITMTLHEQIKQYVPYNEQEAKDRDIILRAMATLSDVLTRNNEVLHFTASAFVFNPDRTRVLMAHHNIYNSWGWMGGHADGDPELFNVAKKELMEEAGLPEANAIQEDIISLDILPVIGHMKNGKYVAAHLHFNVTYIFEVGDEATFQAKLDENSEVGWIELGEVAEKCTEAHMIPIYEKIIEKVKKIGC